MLEPSETLQLLKQLFGAPSVSKVFNFKARAAPGRMASFPITNSSTALNYMACQRFTDFLKLKPEVLANHSTHWIGYVGRMLTKHDKVLVQD